MTGVSHKTQFCQWPDCRTLATRFIRRGEQMEWMACCPPHAQEFHALSNPGAARVSADRQALVYGNGSGMRPRDAA